MNAYQPTAGARVLVTRTMDGHTARWVGIIDDINPGRGFKLTGQRLDGDRPTSVVSYFDADAQSLAHNGITQTMEPAPAV